MQNDEIDTAIFQVEIVGRRQETRLFHKINHAIAFIKRNRYYAMIYHVPSGLFIYERDEKATQIWTWWQTKNGAVSEIYQWEYIINREVAQK